MFVRAISKLLVYVAVLWSLAATTVAQEDFELMEATIEEIHQAVDAGAITYERLTGLYLQRIAQYNPEIKAVTSVNSQAVADAVAMDREYQETGERRSLLHGIPVLLKDLIDQENVPTTAGSVSMQTCVPTEDASITATLRNAGAIILGKTSMSEFAASYGRLGYSSLGGTVLNPYNYNRSASGSSSGSGAAVAANMAVFALGSDTAGSIRGPASATSLVGMKPTHGLVSLDGVVPYSYFVDVLGPMARTVTDAAVALAVMAEINTTDYTSGLQVGALVGKRLARISGWRGGNSDIDALFEASIADMEALGATVVEVNFTDYIDDAEILEGIVSGWSVLGPITNFGCKDINTYLASSTTGEECPDNLTQIVDILDTYADTPFNAMNPPRLDGLKSCVASNETTEDEEYLRITTEVVPGMQQALLSVMEILELDAFIYPTMLCSSRVTWYVDDPTWECDAGDQWETLYLSNIVGWPDISVPMGVVEAGNAPAGISFLGQDMSEATLLAFAYDYEQATVHRVLPPGFGALTGETLSYTVEDGDEGGTTITVVERAEDFGF